VNFDNLFSIEGKVALVTGGSRGIGEMIAAGFLAHGAKVYISSRKGDVCDATAERLAAEFGGECVSLPANLSELDGINALVSQLGEREDRLEILVNNAGVSWGAPIEEFPVLPDPEAPTDARSSWIGRGSGEDHQHRLYRRHQVSDI